MEKEAKKRKQRRSYNCGPCKRQKIKCDTGIPCSACVRHNRIDQCLASPPNPPTNQESDRKKPKHDKEAAEQQSPTSSTANFNKQEIRLPSIKAYTSTFKITGEIQPQQTLIPLSNTAIPWENRAQTDLDKYSYNINSGNSNNSISNNNNNNLEVVELRKEVKGLHERLAFLESKLNAVNSFDQSTAVELKSSHHHSPCNQFIDCIRKLPSIRSLEKILQFYKHSLNNILEIFDNKQIDKSLEVLTSFLEYLNKHSSSSSQPNFITNEQWESLSVISMITSLSILQYPPDLIEQHLNIKLESLVPYSNTLFQISKTSLNSVKYRENPKIIHLKILLLFDKYLHLFTKKSLMLALDSELVSMSYVMGLQTLTIPQNSLEIEQSQRIWWIICHYDALKSLKFQMPPLIRLDTLSNPNGDGSHGGNNPSNTSHILKAFISAENTNYQSIITHIARITKICNEISTSVRHAMVEYLENLIILDRQLTSYQVPQFFSLVKNDTSISFQSCYLHFFIVFSRFRIYKKIYFNNEQFSKEKFDGFSNQSIWFIMLSIVESFLKKYSELRSLYPLTDQNNSIHYIQISEFLVTGAIIHLIMEISPNSIYHPESYKNLMKEYSTMLLKDLKHLRETIFNDSLPFYNQSFKTIERLVDYQSKQEQTFNSPQYLESFEVKQKKLQLANELQSSKVLESMESSTGLIPSNNYFNKYLGSIVHLSRNNYIFQPQQPQQPSASASTATTITSNNDSSSSTAPHAVDNWGLSEVLESDQLEFLNYLGL